MGIPWGKNIALAYLPLELVNPGTRLQIDSFGQMVPAEVQAAALDDPAGTRVRA